MKAKAVVIICGTSNAWKVAEPSDLKFKAIQGGGYHLIMSPKGCFTADSWHKTVKDRKDTAHELFDVRPEAWS